MTTEPPAHLIDWQATTGRRSPRSRPPTRTPASPRPPRRTPRSRRSGRTPTGVPIDAMLFGGRRSTVVPLVHEAFDWEHGVFLGAMMGSETTAAAAGDGRQLRRDPFAMLPFCGYHMADYFAHWLEIGRREGARLPRIFYVNWFRKDPDDGPLPVAGLRRERRVLAWVFRRCDGAAEARRHADRPRAGGGRRSTPPASALARGRARRAAARRPGGVAARGRAHPGVLRQVRRQAAGRAARPARRARGAPAGAPPDVAIVGGGIIGLAAADAWRAAAPAWSCSSAIGRAPASRPVARAGSAICTRRRSRSPRRSRARAGWDAGRSGPASRWSATRARCGSAATRSRTPRGCAPPASRRRCSSTAGERSRRLRRTPGRCSGIRAAARSAPPRAIEWLCGELGDNAAPRRGRAAAPGLVRTDGDRSPRPGRAPCRCADRTVLGRTSPCPGRPPAQRVRVTIARRRHRPTGAGASAR